MGETRDVYEYFCTSTCHQPDSNACTCTHTSMRSAWVLCVLLERSCSSTGKHRPEELFTAAVQTPACERKHERAPNSAIETHAKTHATSLSPAWHSSPSNVPSPIYMYNFICIQL